MVEHLSNRREALEFKPPILSKKKKKDKPNFIIEDIDGVFNGQV
jgi:hypothetical protein